MRWIKSHKLISFLLTVIGVSLMVLVISIATGGKGNVVSRFFSSAIATIEKPIASVAGGIYDNVTGFFTYKEVAEENEKLKEENEKLKQQVASRTLTANELKELKNLSEVLNYDSINGTDDIVSADVTSMSSVNWMSVFTINRGTESGIKEWDIVICGDGLVGRVHSAGKGWAKVVSIIDETTKVSFKISGNLKILGMVEGTKDGKLTGYMLDSAAKVSEGDKIVTSGMGLFPAGIEIGKIVKVKYDSNSQLNTVTIKPFTDFKSLQKVSVIL
ncbi:rod shape-determining protein MreC [Clostridiales Family XIII bacterium PM5-7]